MNPLVKRLSLLGASSVIAVSGAFLIDPFEGNENNAYRDIVGVVTICRGETRGVKMGDYRTDEQCDESTVRELESYNKAMKRHVKVELEPHEEIAYTSFVWNVGETNFKNSTLLKKLNSGDRVGACNELPRWNKSTFSTQGAAAQIKRGEVCTLLQNGKYSCTVKGLTNRRNYEKEVCVGKNKEVLQSLGEIQGRVDK